MIGIVDSFLPLVDDHLSFLAGVIKKNPNEPIFLIGPKMEEMSTIVGELQELIGRFSNVSIISSSRAKKYSFTTLYCSQKKMAESFRADHIVVRTSLASKREKVSSGASFHAPISMLEAMADQELFFCHDIRSAMSKERYGHTVSVAKTARAIAESHGIDGRKAFLAGMLHDVAKDMPKDRQRKMVHRYFPRYEFYPGFSLHQFASRIVAESKFHLRDREILSAIQWHCTGKGRMTPLEIIVYVADKCEPTRPFPTKEIEREAHHDLLSAFRMVLRDQIRYLRRHNIDYHTNASSIAMFHHYLGEDAECH